MRIKTKSIISCLTFTSIFIYYFLYKLLAKRVTFCKWKVLNKNDYDKNRSTIVNYYFNILEKLRIVYFLGFGSELGAVRNGGLVRRDHDVDVIIPVWLNYNIFKCNELVFYNPQKCYIYSDIKTKICNKTKYDYMIIFKEYIERILRMKIDYKCRLWGKYGYTSCWIFNKNNLFLDLWILIGNEYFYQNIIICKCKFSNSLSYCNENAISNVYKMYGDKWYIPIKKGSGEKGCKIILYPNSTNSYIRYVIKKS